MAVWGVGATWNGQDVSKEFIGYETATIGWDKAENPKFHELMEEVRPGDLIFIKARFMMNDPLRIKGIGIVVNTKLCKENGYHDREGIKVHWVKNLTDSPVDISAPSKYGSTHTLYKEDDSEVIQKIVNLL